MYYLDRYAKQNKLAMNVFTLIIAFSNLLSLSSAVGIANNVAQDTISMGKVEEDVQTETETIDNDQNEVVSDPITDALGVLIRDTLTQLANHSLADKTIIIDNEIEDNSFIIEEVNGVQFSPVITVENDMHGSLHGNNNAESESGDVRRQNGVADFEGSLTDNNNAESENGNVIRQNGIIENGVDNTPQNVMDETSALEDKETQQSVEKLDYNIKLGSQKEPKNVDYAPPPNAIIIHNKIRGNTVRRTRSNGVIVVPNINVLNDMSNALYNNNNAKSISGNVDRQNGVADFTEALSNVSMLFE